MAGLVKKILSDQEMDAMAGQADQQPHPGPSGRVLSDAEMDAMDSGQGVPAQAQAPKETMSAARAGSVGLGKFATLGYMPNISGAAYKAVTGLIGDPYEEANQKLVESGLKPANPVPSYTDVRDEVEAEQNKAYEEHPYAYGAGAVAGTLALSPLTKAAAGAAGLSKGSQIAQAAKQGAALGAIQNPGNQAGISGEWQLKDRIMNSAFGAAFGALAQKAANKIANIPNMGDSLKESAEMRGFAATGANAQAAKKAAQFDPSGEVGKTARAIGRYALDNGLVKAGDTIEDVTNKSSGLREEVGSKIGDLYKKAQQYLSNPSFQSKLGDEQKQLIEATDLNPKKMGQEFLEYLASKVQGDPEGDQAVNVAEKLVTNFQKIKGDSFQDINTFKTKLQNLIYAKDMAFQKAGMSSPGDVAYKEMLDFIKDKVSDRLSALDSAFGDKLGQNIKELNKNYSMTSNIYDMARKAYARETGNNFFSLTDKMAGIGGLGVGFIHGAERGGLGYGIKHGLLGGGAALASKAGRAYGRPIAAGLADTAGKTLDYLTPELAKNLSTGAQGLLEANPQIGGLIGSEIAKKSNQKLKDIGIK